jgi:hypothetical protein
MPSIIKPKQTAAGKVITPNGKAKGKVLTQKQARTLQLKKNKKSSKGSTGYSNATRV